MPLEGHKGSHVEFRFLRIEGFPQPAQVSFQETRNRNQESHHSKRFWLDLKIKISDTCKTIFLHKTESYVNAPETISKYSNILIWCNYLDQNAIIRKKTQWKWRIVKCYREINDVATVFPWSSYVRSFLTSKWHAF